MFSISYSSHDSLSQLDTLPNATFIKTQLNDTIGFIQNKEYGAAYDQLQNLTDWFGVFDYIPLGSGSGFLPVVSNMSSLDFNDALMLTFYADLAFQNEFTNESVHNNGLSIHSQVAMENLKLAYQILEGKSYSNPADLKPILTSDLNVTSLYGINNLTNEKTYRLFQDSLELPYLAYPLMVHIDWPLFGILGVGPVKLTVQNIDNGNIMYDKTIESGLLPSDDFDIEVIGRIGEQVNACINVININITRCALYVLPTPVAYQQFAEISSSTTPSPSDSGNPVTELDFFIDNYPVEEMFPYPVINVNITRLQT
jgi:hypothetical protein